MSSVSFLGKLAYEALFEVQIQDTCKLKVIRNENIENFDN